MRFVVLLWSLLMFNIASSSILAQQHHLHSSAGVGSNQLPMYVAKDLGLFEKYGLNVELIVITGGARGLQALFGGSTHSANMAGMAPVRAVLSGGDIVIVGAILNQSLQKFVARKEIRRPAELRNKKIGVANFGGSTPNGWRQNLPISNRSTTSCWGLLQRCYAMIDAALVDSGVSLSRRRAAYRDDFKQPGGGEWAL
jgi:ABC-type nitrate/sulfonate/bicarbonate transport system substrate-binding protein